MSKSKVNALLLTLTMMVTSLSMTSFSQLPQAAHSQTDYEELVITKNNNEQKLNQKNTGSGSSTNINCGTNTITGNSPQASRTLCPSVPGQSPTPGTTVIPVVTQREGNQVDLVITGVTATATCNNDEVVVGGGYRTTKQVVVSEEKVGNTWQRVFVIGSDGQFQALAECLSLLWILFQHR